jgi:hypothetical protein
LGIMVAIWGHGPFCFFDASKVPEGRSSDADCGLRAGEGVMPYATRASNAPSDSWLLVYLRRVELDHDDHDDLDGGAETQSRLHCMNAKYGSTTPQRPKKHELATDRTPKRKRASQQRNAPGTRIQESSIVQPASFSID